MKARFLTGTYTLQSSRARFNQFDVNPQWPLCKKNPKTSEHFLANCDALKEIRNPYLNKIRTLFNCFMLLPIYWNPDSMTALGQRSILVGRFFGQTLVNYVGTTSACSLGHRRTKRCGNVLIR